jgi:hypothetical protein
MSKKITILYLYQRKYSSIETLLESLPKKFRYLSLKATPERAFAYCVSKVPSILVLDKEGEVKATHQGLTSVRNFLEAISEKEKVF